MTASFPARSLAAGILLTLAFFGVASFNMWSAQQGLEELVANDVELVRLGGTIVHLDEVLTMSARMAASTGDARWEERYRSFEPELDATIKAFMRLDPDSVNQASAATDEANAKLVAMENRSFELVRAAKREEAAKVLFSADYETQKSIYAAGTARTLAGSRERVAANIASLSKQIFVATILDLVILAFLGACWFRIYKLIQNHLVARAAAERALEAANAEMEVRVRERTAELEAAQSQLVENSRRAGMAEVATGILHNVGNVLNSITVSVNLLESNVRGSRLAELSRVLGLVETNKDDLPRYLASDPKGKMVIPFIGKLGEALKLEREKALGELESLAKNVEHVRAVVATQQKYARSSVAVLETLSLNTIVSEAITISEASFQGISAEIKSELAELEPVVFDKHLVLQILLNLLSNARHALADKPSDDRQLSIATHADAANAYVEVRDNGVGIPPENLARIFGHGFTTKPQGHGFGLHSSVLAAKQMGGALTCASDGAGHGATFTLSFPRR